MLSPRQAATASERDHANTLEAELALAKAEAATASERDRADALEAELALAKAEAATASGKRDRADALEAELALAKAEAATASERDRAPCARGGVGSHQGRGCDRERARTCERAQQTRNAPFLRRLMLLTTTLRRWKQKVLLKDPDRARFILPAQSPSPACALRRLRAHRSVLLSVS